MTGTVGLGVPPQSQTDPYKTWLDRGATPGQALGLTGQVPPEPESMGGPAPAEQLFEILPGKEKEYEDAKAKIKRHVQQKYGKVLSDDEADRIARGGNLQTTLSIPTLQNLDQQTRLALLEAEQLGEYTRPGTTTPIPTLAGKKQTYEQESAQAAAGGFVKLTIPITAEMLGITALKVGANMPVPAAVSKQIGVQFKAKIGIDATPDQVETLARGGELRNILVPSTTARQLGQGEAALMGELGGRLTLGGKAFKLQEQQLWINKALAEADVTGIYIDPTTGGHYRKETLASQRLQLEQAQVRGTFADGSEIMAMKLAKMDDQRQRDFVLGFDVFGPDGKFVKHIYGQNELPVLLESKREDFEAFLKAGGDWVNEDGDIVHVMGQDELADKEWQRSERSRGGYYRVEYEADGKKPLMYEGKPVITYVMGTQGLARYEIDLRATLDREARADAVAQYAVTNQLNRDQFIEETRQFDAINRLQVKEYRERVRQFTVQTTLNQQQWADKFGLDEREFEQDVKAYQQDYKLEYLRYGTQISQFNKTYKQDQQRVDNQNSQFYAEQSRLTKQYAGYDEPVLDAQGNATFDNMGRPITKHIFGQVEMELERLDVQRTLTVKGFDAERARQLADHLHDREMISGWEEVYTKPDGTAGTRRVMGSQEWTTFTQDREARIQVIMREGGKIVVPNGTNSDGTTKYETLYVTGSAQLAETAADKDWQRRMKEEYGYWDPSERDSKGNPVFRPGRLTQQITLLETQADITDRLARWAAIRQNAHDVLMANTQWNRREKELAWESAEKILDRANGERMAGLLGQREMAQEDRADVRARQAADDTRDLLFITTAGSFVGSLAKLLLGKYLTSPGDQNWAGTWANTVWLTKNGFTPEQAALIAPKFAAVAAGDVVSEVAGARVPEFGGGIGGPPAGVGAGQAIAPTAAATFAAYLPAAGVAAIAIYAGYRFFKELTTKSPALKEAEKASEEQTQAFDTWLLDQAPSHRSSIRAFIRSSGIPWDERGGFLGQAAQVIELRESGDKDGLQELFDMGGGIGTRYQKTNEFLDLLERMDNETSAELAPDMRGLIDRGVFKANVDPDKLLAVDGKTVDRLWRNLPTSMQSASPVSKPSLKTKIEDLAKVGMSLNIMSSADLRNNYLALRDSIYKAYGDGSVIDVESVMTVDEVRTLRETAAQLGIIGETTDEIAANLAYTPMKVGPVVTVPVLAELFKNREVPKLGESGATLMELGAPTTHRVALTDPAAPLVQVRAQALRASGLRDVEDLTPLETGLSESAKRKLYEILGGDKKFDEEEVSAIFGDNFSKTNNMAYSTFLRLVQAKTLTRTGYRAGT